MSVIRLASHYNNDNVTQQTILTQRNSQIPQTKHTDDSYMSDTGDLSAGASVRVLCNVEKGQQLEELVSRVREVRDFIFF